MNTPLAVLALVGFLAVSGVASALLTRRVLAWVRKRSILDVPNGRSSHMHPTPRGGGLALVAVTLAAVALLCLWGAVPIPVGAALLIGGGATALVGWTDDRRQLSRTVRLVTHVVAAAFAAVLLGGLPALRIGSAQIDFGPAGYVVATLGIAGLINFYNFMDGIDGIAAGEAVSVGLVAGVLLLLVDAPGLAAVSGAVAAASGGFLFWNWMPAKIFMGDVGSGFLGFIFGTLALASERAGAVPLLAWIVLLGVFLFDATMTLVRRIVRGEPWYREHRSHAYQRAVQSGATHAQVTARVLALNGLLALLAALGTLRPAWLLPSAATAVLLLATAYLSVERRLPMQRPTATLPQE